MDIKYCIKIKNKVLFIHGWWINIWIIQMFRWYRVEIGGQGHEI